MVWANLDLTSYDRLAHRLHFWVNDVGMVFFFALAAKEVFEATLPRRAAGISASGVIAAGSGSRRYGSSRCYLCRARFELRTTRPNPRMGDSVRD